MDSIRTLLLLALCLTAKQGTAEVLVQSLNGVWTIEEENIPGNVPGGIFTDLENAGILETPIYYRFNDIEYRWVGRQNWTYYRDFEVDANLLAKARVLLTFEGLDTVSKVFLNDQLVGSSDNMFVRYSFDVKDYLVEGTNNIRVEFESPVNYAERKFEEQSADYIVPPACQYFGECHANHIRKMQSSFSWDWGPSFASVGIWHNVSLEAFDQALVRDILVTTTVAEDDSWNVNVVAVLDVATSDVSSLDVTTTLSCGTSSTSTVALSPDSNLEATVNINVSTADCGAVDKWWPNGLGEQSLYSVEVSYTGDGEEHSRSVTFGFRTIELVQDPIEGVSEGLSFYFRVNDQPFFAKGANWIPAHVLPEQVTTEYLSDLLYAAKEANMNMLRVWGGGIYELEAFYDLADQYGIIIWQDFMFACSMYPATDAFLESVSREVVHQVRRLQHHASIGLWAANNENESALRQDWYGTGSNYELYYNDYVKLYADTIRRLVLEEDQSRGFVTSSPTNGKQSEAEGYVGKDPSSPLYGDLHYYNYISDGWDWKIYPTTRFGSEFGFQSFPSFEAIASVSIEEDWSYYSNFTENRQHHPSGQDEMLIEIRHHFTAPTEEQLATAEGFKGMIYLTQINQAMSTKTEAEFYRRHRTELTSDGRGNTMGSLYWQLNDIWQAPTWASIEHGGRWKMLHYYAIRFYAPVLVSPLVDEDQLVVYLISDLLSPLDDLIFTVEVYGWDTLTPLYKDSISQVQAKPESAEEIYRRDLGEILATINQTADSVFLRVTLTDSSNADVSPDNFLFHASFDDVVGLTKANIQVNSVTLSDVAADNYASVFDIELSTDTVAPFVWLEVQGIRGRFSDNGFMMTTEQRTVQFYTKDKVTAEEVEMVLTVKSLLDAYPPVDDQQ